MKTAGTKQKPPRGYQISGHYRRKNVLMQLGSNSLDGRITNGTGAVEMVRRSSPRSWREGKCISSAAGDCESCEPDQAAAAKSGHMAVLAMEPDKRPEKIGAADCAGTAKLADSLARYLAQLGLERRQPPPKTLEQILSEKTETDDAST